MLSQLSCELQPNDWSKRLARPEHVRAASLTLFARLGGSATAAAIGTLLPDEEHLSSGFGGELGFEDCLLDDSSERFCGSMALTVLDQGCNKTGFRHEELNHNRPVRGARTMLRTLALLITVAQTTARANNAPVCAIGLDERIGWSIHGVYDDEGLPVEVEERLSAFFRPHDDAFFEILGRRLPWRN